MKVVSYFNVIFPFQDSLRHVPLTDVAKLIHPHHDDLPQALKYFAGAMHCNPQFWLSTDNLMQFLVIEGNRTDYSKPVLSSFSSLRASIVLFNSGRIPLADIADFIPVDISTFPSTQN